MREVQLIARLLEQVRESPSAVDRLKRNLELALDLPEQLHERPRLVSNPPRE